MSAVDFGCFAARMGDTLMQPECAGLVTVTAKQLVRVTTCALPSSATRGSCARDSRGQDMPERQVRIFIRSDEPHPQWVETLVGRVVKPFVEEKGGALEWFWFSRYACPLDDSGDCDINQIPDECKQPPRHRSVRFRFSVANDQQQEVEADLIEKIAAAGAHISGIIPYNHVADTGNNRFVGAEDRSDAKRQRRAGLVIAYFMSVSKLFLDYLVGPDADNRWRLEDNDDTLQNPERNAFQSLHHMFCNITEVPLVVIFGLKGGVLHAGTRIYPPTAPPGGWDHTGEMRVRY